VNLIFSRFNADIIKAKRNLRGARLEGADLHSTVLPKNHDLLKSIFLGAEFDDNTKLPDAFGTTDEEKVETAFNLGMAYDFPKRWLSCLMDRRGLIRSQCTAAETVVQESDVVEANGKVLLNTGHADTRNTAVSEGPKATHISD
jgi:hypothetical protein